MGHDVGPGAPRGRREGGHDQDRRHHALPAAASAALDAGDRLGLRAGDRDGLGPLAVLVAWGDCGHVVDQRGECARGGQGAPDRLDVAPHLGGRLRSELSVAVGRARHEPVELGGDRRHGGRRTGNPIREVLVRDRHRRLAREGELPGQELVRDDTERVEVAARVGGLAADLLGREVLHGAGHSARLRRAPVGVGASEPEVGHLHHALGRHEDVLGLDVAVHDALRVRVAEREQGLPHDLAGLRGLEGAVEVQQVADAPAPHVLHDHVIDAVDRAPVVYRDDVGVGEPGGRPRLTAEPVDERLVARERAVQHLDRDLAGEHGVAREEDLAHAARGDAFGTV